MTKTTDLLIPWCGARQLLTDHFRCPETDTEFHVAGDLSERPGFFRLGSDTLFGQCSSYRPSNSDATQLPDVSDSISVSDAHVALPFDAAQVVDNLRLERYASTSSRGRSLQAKSASRSLYYMLRPALPMAIRKRFQKLYLRDWEQLFFPRWPVDLTVEHLFQRLLVLLMKSQGLTRIPFVWFWPDGAQSCTIMTHDVETPAGRDFCGQLMDLNDSFGIKGSFQLVPEDRYDVSESFLASMRSRGFEINVQDLNHDGQLFNDHDQFLQRAARINSYAKRFGSKGFRSAVLYRNPNWFSALDFSYDISIPNVAHLDPQRGGSCTVFPYFIGDILELPVTTTQDYSLFHIFGDYSIQLWRKQIALIQEAHGLISFIAHPDYLIDDDSRRVYTELLAYLSELRAQNETWIAPPGDVADWWKLRSKLQLNKVGSSWRIEGPGRERARLAYAVLDGDSVSYELA
jgi:hypothetical protein